MIQHHRTTPAARLLRLALFSVLAFVGLAGLIAAQSIYEPRERTAMVVELHDAISPATADYLRANLNEAAERGVAMVIIELDTPGGLVVSTRQIIRDILDSPVPVATFVSPRGARAASAGTYIAYASHVAAMAPATSLGAATPVSPMGDGGGGGSPFDLPEEENGNGENGASENGENGTNDENDTGAEPAPEDRPAGMSAAEAKALNDAIAFIRGLAELRGRNAEWAERAVRDAATLTASEAAEQNVIDFVASDVSDLLAQAHGMTVELDGADVILDTEDLTLEQITPDWRTQALSLIANPNVALILMLVGVYGLLFEGLNPGALLPGTVGGISLLLGLYALALLPLNIAGAGLILLGIALLIAEAFAPSFGILGIGGTAAMVVGAAILVEGEGPGAEVSVPLIAGIAVTGLILTLIIARLAMGSVKAKVVSGPEEMIGAEGDVMDWDGRQGHVWVHAERWRAISDTPLSPGDPVRVTGLTGLKLRVERAD